MGRTRKTLVALSAGLVGVLIMAGVAAASRGSEHAPAPAVAPHARHLDDATSSSAASTTLATGVSTTLDPERANPEPGDDNGVDAVGATGSTTVDDHGHDAVDEPSTTMPDETSTSMPDDTSTSMPDETSTTLAPINDGPRTFVVAGGSVTVDIEGRVLSLVSVTPNPGVEVKDQKTESDRIEVEFRGPDGDSRVRVRIDNGRLRIETGDN